MLLLIKFKPQLIEQNVSPSSDVNKDFQISAGASKHENITLAFYNIDTFVNYWPQVKFNVDTVIYENIVLLQCCLL